MAKRKADNIDQPMSTKTKLLKLNIKSTQPFKDSYHEIWPCLAASKGGDSLVHCNVCDVDFSSPYAGKPCSPKLLSQECAVDQQSVSLTWMYDPSDNIGYFTVYYETAIFTHGLCSDRTSVVVTDFGQSVGRATLHDLDPETRYKISVTASNEFGESSPTEHLYCRTSATKPELCLL